MNKRLILNATINSGILAFILTFNGIIFTFGGHIIIGVVSLFAGIMTVIETTKLYKLVEELEKGENK